MRKIIIVLLVLILLALAFFAGLSISKISFTGKVVDSSYTWTKALCNSDNECMDVKITCNNGNVETIEPISPIVQNSVNWQDPRIDKSKLC